MKHKYLFLLVALLIFISLVLYKNYIFGGRLFIFEDFGSDSLRMSLPVYSYYFDWLRSGMPWWVDKMGIGASIFSHGDIIFDPFTYILFVFGKSKIIYMFVYMVIAKIIFSGIFFWLFIGKYSKYKFSPFAKIIGSIMYAFGGYMVLVGQNYVFGTIYVYLPLIMLGFEKWLQDRKKWLLILMLTVTSLYFYYFFYMTIIFFVVYAFFRYLSLYSFKLKHFLTYYLSLSGYVLLSLGLSAFYWLPSLILTSNNLRMTSSLPSILEMIMPKLNSFVTMSGRIFGYDFFGNPNFYVGYGADYFQLPLFLGIITLALFSQVMWGANSKKNNAYRIFFISILVLLIIPFFTYLFNGFADFTYRWVYVVHFSFALLLASAIDLVYHKKIFNIKIGTITLAMLMLISAIAALFVGLLRFDSALSFRTDVSLSQVVSALLKIPANLQIFVNSLRESYSVILKDVCFIISYLVLAVLYVRTKYKIVIKSFVLFLLCIEIIWFSSNLINNRQFFDHNIINNRIGFYDNTKSAVEYLKNADKNIYRVDKSYESVRDRWGDTPSENDSLIQDYRGLKSYNSNNQPNYIRFLQNSGVFVIYPNSIPENGMKPQDIRDWNLNFINGVGDRYLLQSFLGVKYYLVKSSENRLKLPNYYKYQTTLGDIDIYKNDYFLPLGFTFDRYISNNDFGKLDNSGKDFALLSFAITDNPNEFENIIARGAVESLGNTLSKEKIGDLIRERKKDVFQIISYKDDNIVGKIDITKNKLLLFTIPYDSGWKIFVDEKKDKLLKVDDGLMGVKLYPGLHTVKLNYFPPGMSIGLFISFLTLISFLFFIKFRNIIGRITSGVKRAMARQVEENILTSNSRKNLLFFSKVKHGVNQLSEKTSGIINKLKQNTIKTFFYAGTGFGISTFFISGLLSRGNSFSNFFSPDKSNSFMDFYNTLFTLLNGPYVCYGSIYPPLPLLMYRAMLRLIPYDIVVQGAFAIRASQAGQIVFLLYILITLLIFFTLLMKVKKGTGVEKYLFIFLMLFTAPFLFQFERANIIFTALLFSIIFVFFKDSKNWFVREFALISLAISAGIKFYPALFGLLLLKERRFNDVFRLILYGLAAFIMPFFTLGGLGQIGILFGNIFSTSNEILKWGLGYSVNIQNIVRIIFVLFGNLSESFIFIGRIFSIVFLLAGIASSFLLRSKWKTVALLSLLMILVPSVSYSYTLIFMIIPLIMFLDTEEKINKINYLYLACFMLLFLPFSLGEVGIISKKLGNSPFPLTYGMLIQNITLIVMATLLVAEALIIKFNKSWMTMMNFLGNIFSSKKAAVIVLSTISMFLFFSLSTYLVFYRSYNSNNYFYKTPGLKQNELSTISQKIGWDGSDTEVRMRVLAKNTIRQNFKATTDNLGIIKVPFITDNKSISDRVIFRLKRTQDKKWYYENTYDASQFQNNIPFPFGFPIINDSRGVSFTFEIESLDGGIDNSLALSKKNSYFQAIYKFSKDDLVKNPNLLFQLFLSKTRAVFSSFSGKDIIFILILTFSPFILYYARAKNSLDERRLLCGFIANVSKKSEKFSKFHWIIPLLVIFIYNLIFFNRYLPISEGWFSVYAWLVNNGQFPYRDFYLFLTPFYTILMSVFTFVFGYSLLYLRIFGLGVILLITYFLYKNFEIIFGTYIAAFVAIVGTIFYQYGNAHITYDFIQFLTLFGLIQSYLLLRYFASASSDTINKGLRLVFWAGSFASLAFLVKQSNGLMIAGFSCLGLLFLSIKRWKWQAFKTTLIYILGFVVPITILALWLLMNSAFSEFIAQAFTGAASAKGGIDQILFSWARGIFSHDYFVGRFKVILGIFIVLGYWLYFLFGRKKEDAGVFKFIMLTAPFILLFIVIFPLSCVDLSTVESLIREKRGIDEIINYITIASITVSIFSILISTFYFVIRKSTRSDIFLLSFVSLGFIYGTGTSAGLSEAGTFIGFCIAVSLMLYYRSTLNLSRIFALLFCIIFCFTLIQFKYKRPYDWWNLTSPDIRSKLQTTDKVQILQGLYTSSENIKIMEEITSEIRSYSEKNDSILTFPNIPIFYLLADRKPPGNALVYWYDFLPDKLALKEAESITRNPPKVVVYLDLGPSVWTSHEQLFRGGKLSGQREIVKAFMGIIKSQNMHISKKYDLENGAAITVWRK